METKRVNGYLYSAGEMEEKVEQTAEELLANQGFTPEEIRKKIIEAE